VHRITTILFTIYNRLALRAIVSLPFLTAPYRLMMISLYNRLPCLLDPNGPSLPMVETLKPGINKLRDILQNHS